MRAPVHTRRRLSAALACLGAIAVFLGVPLAYAGHVLSDTGQFSARATSLLAQPSVRSVIASRTADQLVASENIPAAFAPLIDKAVDLAIGSPAFRPIFDAAVADLHRSVFEQGSDTVTLRLARVGKLIQDTLKRFAPQLAAQIPTSVTDRVIQISGGDFGQATRVARAIQGAHTVGVVLLVAAGIAFVLAILKAGERRRGLRYVGIAILADGLALVVGYALSRSLVVNHFAPGTNRSAAAAVWDVFLAGLRSDAVLLAAAGAVVVAAAVAMWALRPRGRRPTGAPLSAGGGAGRARARPERHR
ncbi:MAG: hypothetical protein ACXVRP_00880 [Solirubrobacteraceae bacterium]